MQSTTTCCTDCVICPQAHVGRMHPEMIRIESFSATSSFLVWVLRHQTGEAYSAALYTSASAPVRSVEVYAPQLEPARQRRRPFLAFTLLWRLSYVFCMSGICRESHQGKPGRYCSVKEHRSQLHQAVDVYVSLLFRWNAVVVVLAVLSFRRQRLRYPDIDGMSWLSVSSTFSQV